MKNNNCLNCKYKKNNIGSSHISCNYPLMDTETKLKISLSMLTNQRNVDLKSNFGFTVSDHPVLQGWFNFPLDFDPNWIEGDCTKHSNLIGDSVEKNLKSKQLLAETQKRIAFVLQKHQKNQNKNTELLLSEAKTLNESSDISNYESFVEKLTSFNNLFDSHFTLEE